MKFSEFLSKTNNEPIANEATETTVIIPELSHIDHVRVMKWMSQNIDSKYDIKKVGDSKYEIKVGSLSDEEVSDLMSYLKSQSYIKESTNEAMVQIAGKDKPSGAKVLATVIADYMEENKMLDANFVSAAHGGKNKKFLVESLAKFIMDNTF